MTSQLRACASSQSRKIKAQTPAYAITPKIRNLSVRPHAPCLAAHAMPSLCPRPFPLSNARSTSVSRHRPYVVTIISPLLQAPITSATPHTHHQPSSSSSQPSSLHSPSFHPQQHQPYCHHPRHHFPIPTRPPARQDLAASAHQVLDLSRPARASFA